MALIDVLPLFIMKPITLDNKPKTKLVAKDTEEDTEEESKTEETTTPSVTISQTPTEVTSSKSTYLPDMYKGYESLVSALDAASVTNPKARMAIIAQMGLEKGWKIPKDFNYGNITAGGSWTGKVTERGDTDIKGNRVTQKFRSYNSSDEFVDDYLKLLKNKYPDSYTELHSKDFDIDRFASGLISGPYKYAEDPTYKSKIKGVYNSVLSNFTKTNS